MDYGAGMYDAQTCPDLGMEGGAATFNGDVNLSEDSNGKILGLVRPDAIQNNAAIDRLNEIDPQGDLGNSGEYSR